MRTTRKDGGLMRSIMRGRGESGDEGFSLVELMVASFILLFALTALLGLIMTSTRMGQLAKQQAALTNSVNAYVEYVRSLPFAEVAISGTTTEAVLPAVHTETRGVFDVAMRLAVAQTVNATSGATMASVKSVTIDATATSPGMSALHVRHTVQIRDRAISLTGGESGGGSSSAIILRFESGTPVEGSAVSGTVPIQIYADAPWTDGRITSVKIYCDGVLLEAADDTTTAAWFPNTQEFTTTFNWYTLQHDENGVQTFQDGAHTIRVAVQDEHSNPRIITRQFVIDNAPPPAPGTPSVIATTATTADIQWAKSYDGITAAYQYQLFSYQNTTQSGDYATWATGPSTTFVSASSTGYEHYLMTGLPPFSRWYVYVRAGSPTPLWSSWKGMAAPFETPPSAAGSTWSVTRPSKKSFVTTVHLTVSPPAFPVTGVTYYFERLDANRQPYATPVVSGPLSTPSWNDTANFTAATGSASAPVYYYRYHVAYTPTGWMGHASDTGWIIVGPTGTSGSGAW